MGLTVTVVSESTILLLMLLLTLLLLLLLMLLMLMLLLLLLMLISNCHILWHCDIFSLFPLFPSMLVYWSMGWASWGGWGLVYQKVSPEHEKELNLGLVEQYWMFHCKLIVFAFPKRKWGRRIFLISFLGTQPTATILFSYFLNEQWDPNVD